MNHKGMSFVETLLTLAILLLIVGSILPLSYQLRTSLHNKKIDYYASEVALNAAKSIKNLGVTKGTQMIEHVQFDWHYNGDEICVSYLKRNEKETKCISQK